MKLKNAFAIQNQDGSFWSPKGTAVASLEDAKIFNVKSHAERKIDVASKKVSQLGKLNVEVVEVVPSVHYSKLVPENIIAPMHMHTHEVHTQNLSGFRPAVVEGVR